MTQKNVALLIDTYDLFQEGQRKKELSEIVQEILDAMKRGEDWRGGSEIELDPDIIKPNPNQPREGYDPDYIRELAESIALHGLIQLPLVIKVGDDYYFIAGHNRGEACKMLKAEGKLETMTCKLVKGEVSEQESFERALDENLKRRDLKVSEQAKALQKLVAFGYSQNEAAKKMGRSSGWGTLMKKVLEFSPHVQRMIDEKELTLPQVEKLHKLKSAGLSDLEIWPFAEEIAEKKIIGTQLDVEIFSLISKHEMKSQFVERVCPKCKTAIQVSRYALTYQSYIQCFICKEMPACKDLILPEEWEKKQEELKLQSLATKDCNTCPLWAEANDERTGFYMAGALGKCTRPGGTCNPDKVRPLPPTPTPEPAPEPTPTPTPEPTTAPEPTELFWGVQSLSNLFDLESTDLSEDDLEHIFHEIFGRDSAHMVEKFLGIYNQQVSALWGGLDAENREKLTRWLWEEL